MRPAGRSARASRRFSGPQSEGFGFARRAGIRAEREVAVHDPRVNRLLILARIVHFYEHHAVGVRKTAGPEAAGTPHRRRHHGARRPRPPRRAGRTVAEHPAVHGAFTTTGPSNLHIAIRVRDLGHLYRFITQDLGSLGVDGAETVIVGHAVKRPGKGPGGRIG